MIYVLFAIFGAIFASFGNVVVSRGPRAWGLVSDYGKPSGLMFPPSQCESCGKRLTPIELLPILSYLANQGRCSSCGSSIGARHLWVEILGLLLGLVIAWRFGLSFQALSAGTLFFFLLCLGVIDLETGYLPDKLTLPLLVLGLVFSHLTGMPGVVDSLLGAVIGGGSFWLTSAIYERLRGREGLGGGDVKLIAAGGAWCGWMALPPILLVASVAGLVFALGAMALGKKERSMTAELRFGPFLSLAIGLVYLLGPLQSFA